jgi:hypothetical protein
MDLAVHHPAGLVFWDGHKPYSPKPVRVDLVGSNITVKHQKEQGQKSNLPVWGNTMLRQSDSNGN